MQGFFYYSRHAPLDSSIRLATARFLPHKTFDERLSLGFQGCPSFAPLRFDPRFQEIVHRLALPQ
jgi:hypothetical protein